MIALQDLHPWIRRVPYLWWAIGVMTLLVTIPVYIAIVIWEERKRLWEALVQAWDLMTYSVKDETDD